MEGSNKCKYDYLEVSNGQTRDSANRVAKLCGTELPKPIISSGPHLFLRFRSDSSMAFKGFKLQFTKTGMAFGTKLSAITGWPEASPILNAPKILNVVQSTKIFRNSDTEWDGMRQTFLKSYFPNTLVTTRDCPVFGKFANIRKLLFHFPLPFTRYPFILQF